MTLLSTTKTKTNLLALQLRPGKQVVKVGTLDWGESVPATHCNLAIVKLNFDPTSVKNVPQIVGGLADHPQCQDCSKAFGLVMLDARAWNKQILPHGKKVESQGELKQPC